MQTHFTPEQRADPKIAEAEAILRKCVHCGFCTATCPTFLVVGDELDSPRGRIYLIKDMLEKGGPATPQVARHLDRCLTCLSCMTTCPSGVDYMHLVDHARVHVEKTYKRPLADKAMRALLAFVLPHPGRMRAALAGALYGAPLRPLLARLPGGFKRLAAMLELAPRPLPARVATEAAGTYAALGTRRGRVALLAGCAQPVLTPEVNAATIALLTRNGIEVVQAEKAGCCGALVHHMGREQTALDQARRNVDAWTAEIEKDGLDAILITASGCGTTVKDYGHMLRFDPAYAEKAARVSRLAKDVTEYLSTIELPPPVVETGFVVAYHSACSMQHGQRVRREPKLLLEKAGFLVRDVPEGHICCGSAGTYNVMQPVIARKLRDRKVGNIEKLTPDIIATGNVGCAMQIGSGTQIPVVHTVELIDWADSGIMPERLVEAGLPKQRMAERAAARAAEDAAEAERRAAAAAAAEEAEKAKAEKAEAE
ncbi:MAG: glycolate oxidase subunit GlcF [Hyphomicrobiales bacterium]